MSDEDLLGPAWFERRGLPLVLLGGVLALFVVQAALRIEAWAPAGAVSSSAAGFDRGRAAEPSRRARGGGVAFGPIGGR